MKHNFLDFMGTTSKKRAPWVIPAFLAAGVILGAALAAAVILWVVPRFTSKIEATPPIVQDVPQEEVKEDALPEEWEEAIFQGSDEAYSIDVAWVKDPRKLATEDARTLLTAPVVGTPDESRVGSAFRILTDEEKDTYGMYNEYYTWKFEGVWDVGEVQSAPWKGAAVYHFRTNLQDMGGGYRHVYLIRPRDGSSEVYGIGAPPAGIETGEPMADLLRGITFLPNASLTGLEMPEELVLENGEKIFKDESRPFFSETYWFDEAPSIREVTRTRDGRIVYEYREQSDNSEAGCLFLFAPDGERVQYRSVLPRDVTQRERDGMVLEGSPLIEWDTAYRAAADVDYMERRFSGCGGYACTMIVPDRDARAGGGLTRAGVTEEGDIVYVPTRPQDHPVVKELYDGWYLPDGKPKPSIAEMVQTYSVPLFYWKDALGRWVEYRSLGILPMAECGKPVIYLYPEQTMDVSVRLPLFINVTVSDPAYPFGGWNVTAQPNGQLTSHADGKMYGSLYWEGTGVGYAPPKEGFVVKDGEVESFLRGVLPTYGLNETEAREFMEFWVPEMTGAPYYRVSFLTSAWSDAAPLSVTPRPQTSIRLFMDWKPLNAPISLPKPTIVTPERNGFTLVEWGGTLWK